MAKYVPGTQKTNWLLFSFWVHQWYSLVKRMGNFLSICKPLACSFQNYHVYCWGSTVVGHVKRRETTFSPRSRWLGSDINLINCCLFRLHWWFLSPLPISVDSPTPATSAVKNPTTTSVFCLPFFGSVSTHLSLFLLISLHSLSSCFLWFLFSTCFSPCFLLLLSCVCR